jgi:hypothetical protein
MQESPLYTLDQMIDAFGLNPYATLAADKDDIIMDTRVSGIFNVVKLREAQNLDWAEDSIINGLKYEET